MSIKLSKHNCQKVARELSILLANEHVLFIKTKSAHWNSEGLDFYEKHQIFDQQANQLAFIADSVAERIRILGEVAPASLKAFLSLTQLSETDVLSGSSTSFITNLLVDHEMIIAHLRENIGRFADEYGDYGSSDFITGLLQEHEKTAWILRTLLK